MPAAAISSASHAVSLSLSQAGSVRPARVSAMAPTLRPLVNRTFLPMATFPRSTAGMAPLARPRARPVLAAAAGSEEAPEDPYRESPASSLAKIAPVELQTPVGEFLSHMLTKEPHLFEAAAMEQLNTLGGQKQALLGDGGPPADKGKSELVLYKRMGDLKLAENEKAAVDLMYLLVCKEFIDIGVPLTPPLDGLVDLDPVNLKALTGDIHSVEALEMVRNHLVGVLGGQPPMAMMTNAPIKMSKMQAAQVYAASVMFGYFLRKVDKRFRLERTMGTLDLDGDEGVSNVTVDSDSAISRLEELFAGPTAEEPSATDATYDVSDGKFSYEGGKKEGAKEGGGAEGGEGDQAAPDKDALRKYVEGFDQATMSDTARIVSREGVKLVERHTAALFGDLAELQKQMQAVLGDDPLMEPEDVIARLQEAVGKDEIETVTLTYITQRRVVLEAVAFGTFLHDVESEVGFSEYELTPASLPPGASPGGPPRGGPAGAV